MHDCVYDCVLVITLHGEEAIHVLWDRIEDMAVNTKVLNVSVEEIRVWNLVQLLHFVYCDVVIQINVQETLMDCRVLESCLNIDVSIGTGCSNVNISDEGVDALLCDIDNVHMIRDVNMHSDKSFVFTLKSLKLPKIHIYVTISQNLLLSICGFGCLLLVAAVCNMKAVVFVCDG
jgi:hypothetical protein